MKFALKTLCLAIALSLAVPLLAPSAHAADTTISDCRKDEACNKSFTWLDALKAAPGKMKEWALQKVGMGKASGDIQKPGAGDWASGEQGTLAAQPGADPYLPSAKQQDLTQRDNKVYARLDTACRGEEATGPHVYMCRLVLKDLNALEAAQASYSSNAAYQAAYPGGFSSRAAELAGSLGFRRVNGKWDENYDTFALKEAQGKIASGEEAAPQAASAAFVPFNMDNLSKACRSHVSKVDTDAKIAAHNKNILANPLAAAQIADLKKWIAENTAEKREESTSEYLNYEKCIYETRLAELESGKATPAIAAAPEAGGSTGSSAMANLDRHAEWPAIMAALTDNCRTASVKFGGDATKNTAEFNQGYLSNFGYDDNLITLNYHLSSLNSQDDPNAIPEVRNGRSYMICMYGARLKMLEDANSGSHYHAINDHNYTRLALSDIGAQCDHIVEESGIGNVKETLEKGQSRMLFTPTQAVDKLEYEAKNMGILSEYDANPKDKQTMYAYMACLYEARIEQLGN
jgi:hypothetical protein